MKEDLENQLAEKDALYHPIFELITEKVDEKFASGMIELEEAIDAMVMKFVETLAAFLKSA